MTLIIFSGIFWGPRNLMGDRKGRWRCVRDSNPRYHCWHTAFRVRRFRPLSQRTSWTGQRVAIIPQRCNPYWAMLECSAILSGRGQGPGRNKALQSAGKSLLPRGIARRLRSLSINQKRNAAIRKITMMLTLAGAGSTATAGQTYRQPVSRNLRSAPASTGASAIISAATSLIASLVA